MITFDGRVVVFETSLTDLVLMQVGKSLAARANLQESVQGRLLMK